MLAPGTRAPDFALPDQHGKEHKLSDYRGRWVLLYFYPKDDTQGCTKEACAIRDDVPQFEKLDAAVFGISADSEKSHEKFAEKYDLNFTLLADTQKKAIEQYQAWGKKKFMGHEYKGVLRVSYLIDPDGMIAKAYEKVKPAEHAAEVLADIAALRGA
jgi:peroxiredoxin Q/BCP